MKTNSIVLYAVALLTVSMSALWAHADTAVGYGAKATGGGTASPTLVTSVSELKSALSASGKKVIIITKSLTFTSQLSVKTTDKTLMALPGVTLTNAQGSGEIKSESDAKSKTGILEFKTSSNIVLRNLTFVGPGAWDCEGNDDLSFDGVTQAWIDHCEFQDGIDGNFDIKGASDNITISNCRFRYLKGATPKSTWCKDSGSDDHRFSNLVGSGSSDKPSNRRITYQLCWWDEGCVQRMPRARHSTFHLLNCYWNSSKASVDLGLGNCTAYVEGCHFTHKSSVIYRDYSSSDGGSNKLKFVNSYTSSGSLPGDIGSVAAPTYSYTALPYADVKKTVTDATCGAGATLQVKTDGTVSTNCGTQEQNPEPTPNPVTPKGGCCIVMTAGDVPTVGNGGIPKEWTEVDITVNNTKSTWDANDGIKLGGNADYVVFDFSRYKDIAISSVEFDVTIPNWTAEHNTVGYRFAADGTNQRYEVKSEKEELVTLVPTGETRVFVIQRTASTSTNIKKVCFNFSASSSASALQETSSQGLHYDGRLLHNPSCQQVKVYDLNGHLLLQSYLSQIDMTDLLHGVYVVRQADYVRKIVR